MALKGVAFAAIGLSLAQLMGAEVQFDVANKFANWGNPRNCVVARVGEVLQLDVTNKDSSIEHRQLALNPAEVQQIEVVYRAKGFQKNTTGQLFFADVQQKNWDGNQYFNFYNLKSDWQFHTLILKVNGANLAHGVETWTKRATIDKVRLDLVDQFPGLIEIKSIKFKSAAKKVLPQQITWHCGNKFSGWGYPRNCQVSRTAAGLKLAITGRDSSIEHRNVAIDPKFYNRLDIVYRASGLPRQTTGQLFFADVKQKSWNGNQYFSFYNIKSDGQWHTLTLRTTAQNLAHGEATWTQRALINKIRLDLVDQAPGTIEIKSITWSREGGKAPLFAKLGPWPEVKAQLGSKKNSKIDLGRPYFQGWMLQSQRDVPTKLASGYRALSSRQNAFAFRRIFFAPREMERALIQMTADDRFELFVNGRKVLENHLTDGWRDPQSCEVTQLLKPGEKNILAGYYRNLAGPGGMLLELTILDKKGQPTFIVSDQQFKSVNLPTDKQYLKLDFNDAAWPAMTPVPPPPAMPWNYTLKYVDIVPHPELNAHVVAPAQAVPAGAVWPLKLSGQGALPKVGSQLTVKISTPEKVLVSEVKYRLKPDMIQGNASAWRITVPVKLARWYSTDKFQIQLSFRDYKLPGARGMITLPVIPRKPGEMATYRVAPNAAGVPEILRNGQPIYPLIGNCSRDLDNCKFYDVPMHFRTVWCRNNGFWTGENEYNFSALDKRFQAVLNRDPDTPVIVWFGCDAPLWWAKKYPQELMRFNDGTNWSYQLATMSFSSQKFRRDVTKMMQVLLDYIVHKAPYRDRIAGVSINGGYSSEWQNWGCHAAKGLDKLSDYSGVQQQGFAQFAQKNYPELASTNYRIPDFKTRIQRQGDDIFFPAATLQRNLAYNDYMSQSVASLLAHLVKQARLVVGPDKLLGAYYGYTLEYPNLGWAFQLSGHYALRKILQLTEIDFLMSPPSYGVRCIGDCGEDMKPFASIRAAGKVPLVDDDTRTDMTGVLDFFQTVNRDQTRQVLRRNFGRCLARLEPICVFSLGEGTEFAAPETIADLQVMKKVGQQALKLGARPNAEVAVVVSEKAHLTLAFAENQVPQGQRQWYNAAGRVSRTARMVQPTVGESISYQRCRLAQTGLAYDFILAEDLARVVDKPYKVWIFLNAFNPDSQFVEAVKKLQQRSVTLLWLRAPGQYFNGQLADAAFRKRLTGLGLAQLPAAENIMVFPSGKRVGNYGKTAPLYQVKSAPGVKALAKYETFPQAVAAAEIKLGKCKSIFYSGEVLTPEFLRQVAKKAGVHVYSAGNDIVYANTHFLTYHTATAGVKTVVFPQRCDVVDVFTQKVVARNVKTWRFKARLHETRLVFYGNAADLGNVQ